MSDKLVSPEGEQFQIADEPGDPGFGQGAPDPFGERIEPLWSTKEGDVLLYADAEGNINPSRSALAGLYHRDTRFLSELMLLIDGRVPMHLSTSTERGFMSHIDLSKQDVILDANGIATLGQAVNIRRTRVIKDRLYERVRLRNYHRQPISLRVTLTLGADFADIYEVRGLRRPQRGARGVPRANAEGAVFCYRGTDDEWRETRVSFDQPPTNCEVRGDRVVASWRYNLAPGETQVVSFTVEPRVGTATPPPGRFDTASHELRRSYESWERDSTQITTSNELFDELLRRGRRDLRALLTPTPYGELVAAGIPWMVAPFGRDALLAAHQFLMVNPGLARSTLEVLAAYQGTEENDWRDEEPGKIFHELRRGEVAAAGLVPSPYYGAVDTTPLWLMLLGTYWRWTADEPFCRKMLPHADRAIAWMDKYGDADGDGFIEYRSRSANGLANHGWRNSPDAVVHADATPAGGPIALAEVQGYAYLARLRIADLYEALGRPDDAEAQRRAAADLARRFVEAFWVEEEQYLAMALDGDKRQVTTVSSTPAHVLYCGLLDGEKAAAVARRLLAPDMFSGWGIRTVSKSAAVYNPMSYHNGSIWPHDNALVAAGLKRQGSLTGTNRVATALFDMAVTMDEDMRLPQLFCGFTRRTPNRPVAYPVACLPSATAAGAPFLLLQAMLGLSANAPENVLTINKPLLPPWLHTVELRNLEVGGSTISLVFTRHGETTGFSLLEKQGNVRVLMEE